MLKISNDLEVRHTITPGDLKVCIKICGILYEVGHLSSYSLKTEVEEVPAFVFGEKYAVTDFKGKRSHQGTLIFNVINQSLVHELKTIMQETKNPAISKGGFNTRIEATTFDDGSGFEENLGALVKVDTDLDNVNAMDLPPFDIIMTFQDKLIPTRFSQKRIIGVTIVGQSNAIGLDTVNTQDAYSFLAKSVSPLLVFDSDTSELNDAVNSALNDMENGKFVSSFF